MVDHGDDLLVWGPVSSVYEECFLLILIPVDFRHVASRGGPLEFGKLIGSRSNAVFPYVVEVQFHKRCREDALFLVVD